MALNKLDLYRREFLGEIAMDILHQDETMLVNIADKSNKASKNVSVCLANELGGALCSEKIVGQTAGNLFAQKVKIFLEKSFHELRHINPTMWEIHTEKEIYLYEQYNHLQVIKELIETNKKLETIIGIDYLVKPDIVIIRNPLSDKDIGYDKHPPKIAQATPLRADAENNSNVAILQGIVSCKWTIRSDRAQNTRTEAQNIIRNRKGRTPCITAITAEPLPSRIASLALGLGDLDCVYHMALYELEEAIKKALSKENMKNSRKALEEQINTLQVLINGKRLRDVSDLPLDLIT